MKLNLSISVSDSLVPDTVVLFKELSTIVNLFLEDKEYGEDIKLIQGRFIMVLERPGYENWYKPRKLSYIDHKVSKSKLTGEVIEVNKQLSFEIRLDENSIGFIANSNAVESRKFILQLTLKYLTAIKKLPGKIKDFNLELFLRDLNFVLDNYVEDDNYVS